MQLNPKGKLFVYRGGSMRSNIRYGRVALRSGDSPTLAYRQLGFRVVFAIVVRKK